MEAAAERACRHLGYRNAGTFEFLVGPDGSFSFIELNARLQVEHPVTELVTGLDIVREQIRVAAGEPLSLTGRAPRGGHAIEIRINAEDPERDFAPSPGTITRFRPPLGPFDRVDTFAEDGAVVPPFYDSLVAKVIVWDVDRPAAIARARRALGELVIDGITTTRDFASGVLDSRAFRSGEYSTSFLAEQVARRVTDPLVLTEPDGTITIAADVLDRIVRRAAEQVDGVKVRRRGLDVKDGRVDPAGLRPLRRRAVHGRRAGADAGVGEPARRVRPRACGVTSRSRS